MHDAILEHIIDWARSRYPLYEINNVNGEVKLTYGVYSKYLYINGDQVGSHESVLWIEMHSTGMWVELTDPNAVLMIYAIIEQWHKKVQVAHGKAIITMKIMNTGSNYGN